MRSGLKALKKVLSRALLLLDLFIIIKTGRGVPPSDQFTPQVVGS
jgi:hypothetical protein